MVGFLLRRRSPGPTAPLAADPRTLLMQVGIVSLVVGPPNDFALFVLSCTCLIWVPTCRVWLEAYLTQLMCASSCHCRITHMALGQSESS